MNIQNSYLQTTDLYEKSLKSLYYMDCIDSNFNTFILIHSFQGLLWCLRPHDIEMEIIDHTRELMTKVLKEETGLETGWVETGGLFIASNKERLDEYQVMSTVIECTHSELAERQGEGN